MSQLVRLSLSIEESLLEHLDNMAKCSGYTNRSEFVRDLVRERLVKEEWEANAQVVATLTLIYDHKVRLLNEKLNEIQHQYHDLVLASTHVHLDGEKCVESIMMRGRAGDIKDITDVLRKNKGIYHAALSMSSTGKDLV